MPLIPGGGRKRFRAAVAPPEDLGVNTIFFDDFSDDVGWFPANSSNPNYINKPSKWTSYQQQSGQLQHEINTGFGKDGGPGYRHKLLGWPVTGFRETGRLTIGFPETLEVHIRFDMKFSEGFGFFSYGGTAFQKTFRLWQSKWTGGASPPFGTSGQLESDYIVVDLGPSGVNQGTAPYSAFSHYASYRSTSEISTGNPAVIYYRRINDSSMHVPFGDLDSNYVMTNTQWVQCDFYYRLGDTNQDNGEIRQWYNGVEMLINTRQPVLGGSAPITGTGLVTNPRSHWGNPPGFNTIMFLDNYAALTGTWTEQHYIYMDNVRIFSGGIPNDLPQ